MAVYSDGDTYSVTDFDSNELHGTTRAAIGFAATRQPNRTAGRHVVNHHEQVQRPFTPPETLIALQTPTAMNCTALQERRSDSPPHDSQYDCWEACSKSPRTSSAAVYSAGDNYSVTDFNCDEQHGTTRAAIGFRRHTTAKSVWYHVS